MSNGKNIAHSRSSMEVNVGTDVNSNFHDARTGVICGKPPIATTEDQKRSELAGIGSQFSTDNGHLDCRLADMASDLLKL